MQEVESHFRRLGINVEGHTYHQMPNHKKLEKVLGEKNSVVMEDVYAWEFKHANTLASLNLHERESLFPTVAVWGRR